MRRQANSAVSNSVEPELHRVRKKLERAARYELHQGDHASPSLLPNMSDVIGTVMGLLLIWLIYTAAISGIEFMQSAADKTVSHARATERSLSTLKKSSSITLLKSTSLPKTTKRLSAKRKPHVASSSAVSAPSAESKTVLESLLTGIVTKAREFRLGVKHAAAPVIEKMSVKSPQISPVSPVPEESSTNATRRF